MLEGLSQLGVDTSYTWDELIFTLSIRRRLRVFLHDKIYDFSKGGNKSCQVRDFILTKNNSTQNVSHIIN